MCYDRPMANIYLAFGSNQGQATDNLRKAISLLSPLVTVNETAPFYQSHAVGFTNQPDFINTVVTGTTDLKPQELLSFLKQTELRVGRVERFRWGPREIDIDIIFYDTVVMQSQSLTIPHPEFANRDFVLQPLCDLNVSLIDPKSKQSVRQLLDNLPENRKSGLKRLT